MGNAPPLAQSKKHISTIYFGGGTPTSLSAHDLSSILDSIHKTSQVDTDAEITIEANPESFNKAFAQQLRNMGFNRLSFGVQSFDDALLKRLGRQHDSAKAKEAINIASACGFTNITIDLMYEVPDQTIASWEATLNQIEHLPITHLSLYNLTIEPETVFFKKRKTLIPLLPTPEENLTMLEMAVTKLESYGLKRYEISAFAKEGYTSRHNTGYWTARPFLGLGPSAFSYWNKSRQRNVCALNTYHQKIQVGASAIDFEEQLPYPRNLCELLAVNLRLIAGVDLKAFSSLHGELPGETMKSIETLIEKRWLKRTDDTLSLTKEGMLFYDSVAVELI